METKQWTVIDKNAITAPRKHEVITRLFDDGREPLVKIYALNAETGTPMPMEHALKFLSDTAFEVVSPDGMVMIPPPKQEGGTGSFELPDHQTIANWEELSVAALFKRCKVVPGSEAMKPDTPKAEMVEFLTKMRKDQKTPTSTDVMSEAIGGKADIGGVAPKEQLDAMFGDSPLLANAH